jgi:primosomal protein N' (replication factor Y)
MPEYVNVLLLSPPFATLTYAVPVRFSRLPIQPGLRVLVPMGRSLRAAIILDTKATPPPGVEMKDLLWPLETTPILSPAYVDLARNLAARQMAPLGQVLAGLLPAGLKSGKAVLVQAGQGQTRGTPLAQLAVMPEDRLTELAEDFCAGQCFVRNAATKQEAAYRALADPPWPVRPGATAQVAVLEHLFEHGPATAKQLRQTLGPNILAALKTLEAKGLITPQDAVEPESSPQASPSPRSRPPLTAEQDSALKALLPLLMSGQGGERLVHGVTGSGKTRLYFELAEACLRQGRPVMLLAPEVALASALLQRSLAWFKTSPLYYHGSLPPTQREKIFRELAASQDPRLVIGTRSALFLPVCDPGLIILDEEHDCSFKQDERLAYQAKEVAFYLARRSGGLLLLGSATPDVKTYHAAREGLAPMVVLANRVGSSRPPGIELVDLLPRDKAAQATDGLEGGGAGLLTEESLAALRETIERGEQAIILLNRRGYAPILYCLDCKETLRCKTCEVSLTYHKKRERLVCHYCGTSQPFPLPCGKCGGANFLPMGQGTEMLAEHLSAVLPPKTTVGRLDRDIARRVGRAEAILEDFAQGRTQVLVGTQMLSKGHHFPAVTLVIVADGDMGLNLPDYRAPERCFQMLLQVAGRAGRGDKPGRVLIQTRSPHEPFWTFVKNADFQGFFEQELARRQRYSYPPFVKLGLVRASFPRDWDHGGQALVGLSEGLRAGGRVKVLGPAPAPIPLIKDRKRFQCLLKAQDWPSIREAYAEALRRVGTAGKLRLQLDLDPVDML